MDFTPESPPPSQETQGQSVLAETQLKCLQLPQTTPWTSVLSGIQEQEQVVALVSGFENF